MRTLLATAGLCALVATGATATAIVERTARVTRAADGAGANGASSRPSLSRSGRVVAFDSEASNLAADRNGSVRDVFRRDLDARETQLVSVAADGGPADGPSDSPVLSGRGDVVVFTSRATNLVPGDANGARDVFLRRGGDPVQRVSLTPQGGEANGASFQPDVSADGTRVVFTSLADNLVAGDTNGVEDVFVRDLATGLATRVSQRLDGSSFSGRSRAPSISADGRWVSFESTAADAVPGDDNGVPDVFLADLRDGSVERVSLGDREQEQSRAVVPPFVTVSDVSRGGRYVVWDSDASNLVRGDANRDTDVFLRDRRRGRTFLISRSATGRLGDNDSYLPAISDDGRFVTFSSFARNLWPVDRGGEDVFLHDRRVRVTAPLTVTSRGGRRPAETERQLLRRAPMSADGRWVAFTSTAALTAGDTNRREDVHVRDTAAPTGHIVHGPDGTTRLRRPRYGLKADDPRAVFLCRVDRRRPYFCPARGRLPRLSRGRHRFSIRAGGPGMQFDVTHEARRFRVR